MGSLNFVREYKKKIDIAMASKQRDSRSVCSGIEYKGIVLYNEHACICEEYIRFRIDVFKK